MDAYHQLFSLGVRNAPPKNGKETIGSVPRCLVLPGFFLELDGLCDRSAGRGGPLGPDAWNRKNSKPPIGATFGVLSNQIAS